MAMCPFSPRRNMANLGDFFPPTKILWFEVAGPFFFVWCEISPEIKRCSHNRTASQGSLFNFLCHRKFGDYFQKN
jgi:hypothetical protein